MRSMRRRPDGAVCCLRLGTLLCVLCWHSDGFDTITQHVDRRSLIVVPSLIGDCTVLLREGGVVALPNTMELKDHKNQHERTDILWAQTACDRSRRVYVFVCEPVN